MSQFKSRVDEAFDFTIKQVEELKSMGIANYTEKSYSADDESTILKYNYEWILDHEKWIRIVFTIKEREDLDNIMKKEELIRKKYGVAFDTGFGGSFREWELDWSFQIVSQKNRKGEYSG
jgi:hypothetical protein